MNSENTRILVGPPGTGKTTTLLELVEDRLDKRVNPREIGYVSFTNKAADEARDRACAKFNLDANDFPYFRTLHSMAFRMLGLRREQVLASSRHKRELAARLKVDIDLRGSSLDHGEFVAPAGSRHGDKLMFWDQKARNRGISPRKQWERDPADEFGPDELEQFSVGYALFKRETGLLDFTDMLEKFVADGGAPALDTLFIDEAQDLTLLQWKAAHELSENVHQIYVAGDDDQAIYDWAGADSSILVGLEGRRTVLDQSYRVPEKVHEVALDIVNRIPPSQRIEKAYAPRSHPGQVKKIAGIADIPLETGEWLVLARNLYLLEEIRNRCFEEGFAYSYRKHSPVTPGVWKAISIWERLRKSFSDKVVTLNDVNHLYQFITTGAAGIRRGMKGAVKKQIKEGGGDILVCMEDLHSVYGLCVDGAAPWNEALDRVPGEYISYLDAAHKRGEDPAHPRILINTIHSAKGGEADNVCLLQDMSYASYRSYEKDPASEARTFYVGVTRARENLYVLEPMSENYFPVLA